MKERIKWVRLQEIATDLTGRPSEITLSTMLPNQMISAVEYGPSGVQYVLNADRCKSVEDVVTALAHEIAHVVKNDPEDSFQVTEEWDRLIPLISAKYLN